MALEIVTRRASEGESASEARALIEGGDGREAWVVIGSMGKPLRCFARTPTTQFTGRRQTPKAAVDAPVQLEVRRHTHFAISLNPKALNISR
ncbi:MAG: hypothetical protein ACT4QB_13030, partial [Gammaproteobacteria bacterium]